MIEEVWRRTRRAERIDDLVVATDDRRIADACDAFGARTAMTSPDHASGTDRAAEVLRNAEAAYERILVVQGDEPLVTASSLDRLIDALDDGTAEMATLSEPLTDADELFDPNVVKLVTRSDGCALYFSRSPIPYHRGALTRLAPDFRVPLSQRPGGLAGYRKHQGIYSYTRACLLALTARDPAPIELDEGLEQLRALDAGYTIRVVESDFRSLSVDTPEDLKRVEAMRTEAS